MKHHFDQQFMDAYEVHKKIQEAIVAVQIYNLSSQFRSSMWDREIRKGLEQLSREREMLPANDEPAMSAKHS